MKTVRSTEVCIGLGLVLLAIATGLIARTFPAGSPNVPGPAVFPLLMSGLSGVLGLALAATGFSRGSGEETPVAQPGSAQRRIPAVLMATLVYALLMPYAGFVSSSTAYLAVLMLLLGYPHKARATALSFVVSFVIFGLFAGVMKVPLPTGWLG